MKAFKTIMNVFGIIGASILSVMLVAVLVVTPLVSAVSSFFKTDSIQDILSDIDFTEMIISEMELDEDGEMKAEFVEDIMNSDMMEEVLELTVDNLLDIMDGTSSKSSLTGADIEAVARKHTDEITSIFKKNYVGEIEIPDDFDEYIDEMVDSLIGELAESFAEEMPTAEELGIDRETVNTISKLRSGTYVKLIIIIAVILTVLVMLCQVMRFKGFMWISVDYYIAALGTLILGFLIKTFDLARMFSDEVIGVSVVSSIVGMISGKLIKGAIILLVLGILFTVIFVVGRKAIKKKNLSVNGMIGM